MGVSEVITLERIIKNMQASDVGLMLSKGVARYRQFFILAVGRISVWYVSQSRAAISDPWSQGWLVGKWCDEVCLKRTLAGVDHGHACLASGCKYKNLNA